MIVKENLTINGRDFIRTYSDKEMRVEREGILYSEAIDPAEFGREYTETNMPINDEPTSEIEEKAKAYDILMGVNE